jgi:hypothetical protein
MNFRYLRDPLFLFCVALYFLNRWLLKPYFSSVFLHSYLNDVICIPFWVPIMVWGMRKLRLRADDEPPQWYEIIIPLLLWSFVFESWLPRMPAFRHLATADPNDILAYTAGATVASLFWQWYYREPAGVTPRVNPVK